jgi:hypothetical protein
MAENEFEIMEISFQALSWRQVGDGDEHEIFPIWGFLALTNW